MTAVWLLFAVASAPAATNSTGVLTLQLLGDNPFTNQCHTAFADPGATATGSPVALAAGNNHTLALRANGTILGWGRNEYGQTNAPLPATNITALAAGYGNNLALKADGTVLGWGRNEYGQTNVPPAATNIAAIAAGNAHCLTLSTNGSVLAWGYNGYGQTNTPPSATNVVAIAAGCYHNLALKADGSVLAWGYNFYGQTNIPAAATNVVAISAGCHHNLAQKANGSLVAWGYNLYGQTNIPAAATNIISFVAGQYHNLALRTDGAVVAWGYNNHGQINVPAAATNVIAIAAGEYHSLALKADGTVVGWGYNDYGQTTAPTGLTVSLPVAVSGVVNTNVPGNYTLTYTVTNISGNVMTATRTVVVVDTTPPVITINGSNPLTNECYSAFVDPGATAYDLYSGSSAVTTNGNVDFNLPGTYAITYTAADSFGNSATNIRIVVIVDTTPPVLTMNSPSIMFITNASRIFTDPGATAVDPGAGSVPVVTNNGVNVNFPGVYTITYRATDGSGNSATNTRTVLVTLPPLVAGDANGDGVVDATEAAGVMQTLNPDALSAAMQNYWAANTNWITRLTGVAPGQFEFGLTNATGLNFTMLVSTNLTDWEVLTNAALQFHFHDEATNAPQRFYRLRWP